MIIGFQP
ncbi:hypothetical protein EC951288_3737A, partial [Escherichia coli 95.1288]